MMDMPLEFLDWDHGEGCTEECSFTLIETACISCSALFMICQIHESNVEECPDCA